MARWPSRATGVGLAATAAGSGIAASYGACLAPALAQAEPGTLITVPGTDTEPPPPAGNAFFYLAGHAFPSPEALGFTSNGKLRKATASCP